MKTDDEFKSFLALISTLVNKSQSELVRDAVIEKAARLKDEHPEISKRLKSLTISP